VPFVDITADRPRSIAVVRALQLGDLLCAVPSLRALRRALPRARVTLVGLPWARAFAARFSRYVDEFLALPGYPGLPEIEADVRRLPRFLADAQARRFDLAIQLHGSGAHVNSLAAMLGARRSAGFFVPGEWCPDPSSYVPWPEKGSEVRRLAALISALGARVDDESLEFPLTEEDEREARGVIERAGLEPGRYVVVHPGARWPSRRWGAARFAAVADELAARGWAVVLTGAAEESGLVAETRARMRAPALDASGRTSLGGLAALLKSARLLVSNDTGVSHVAAGVGARSVVIANGSDADRWAPLDARRHRVLAHEVDCRPCGHRECPFEGHPCAAGVAASAVIAEALAVLEAA
jgi:ADP-heptose:LPS heptosyltransferase